MSIYLLHCACSIYSSTLYKAGDKCLNCKGIIAEGLPSYRVWLTEEENQKWWEGML